MYGTSRLLVFTFRALVLALIVSMLWVMVARYYNEAVVYLADTISPDHTSFKALGARILIDTSERAAPLSIDSFTLHYGLILMVVLVLAAVGIGVLPRIKWLIALGLAAFAVNVVGIVLLAVGTNLVGEGATSERLVFSIFAVLWGLLPAVAGGIWCFAYWMPHEPEYRV